MSILVVNIQLSDAHVLLCLLEVPHVFACLLDSKNPVTHSKGFTPRSCLSISTFDEDLLNSTTELPSSLKTTRRLQGK